MHAETGRKVLKSRVFSCQLATVFGFFFPHSEPIIAMGRFEKPQDRQTASQAAQEQLPAHPEVEDVPFCIPADGVFRRGCQWAATESCCWSNDCDALFTPPDLRRRQERWEHPEAPMLIVAAGPERSGSTWLFNAVRLLFESAKLPLDCYWIKDLTDASLDVRRAGAFFPAVFNVLFLLFYLQ
jgi:hypothetical protein